MALTIYLFVVFLLYMNRLHPRVEAIRMAVDMIGVENPHIYYPGCGDDLSFEGIGRITYVDIARYAGNKAIIQADATKFQVEDEVDIVAMFDIGDHGKEQVISNLTLSANGLVLWRSYNASVPELAGPSLTFESLMGVLVAGQEETVFEDSALERFFEFTPLEETDPSIVEALTAHFAKQGQQLPSEAAEAWGGVRRSDHFRYIPQYVRNDLWRTFVFQPLIRT